jgi:adenylate kinase family enzyme
MIVGQPGSGKSSLARAMALRSGLPVIHIDKIHQRPGWVERGREEKTRLCRDAEAGIDGFSKGAIRRPGTAAWRAPIS